MSLRPALILPLLCALLAPCLASAQELPGQLVFQGERFLNMGKYEAALGQYAKVIECCENSPEGAEAHNDMGVACMRLNRPEEAVAHYEAAIAINDYPLAYFNLGKALAARYHDKGDPADRERGLELLEMFQIYMQEVDPEELPPSITYQREEFEENLRSSIENLRR